MIARALEKESYRPGETIVRQGEEGHMFYLLYSGEVECFQKKNADDASEKPVMLRKLKPGDYFGERALVGEKPIRTASCIASDSGPVDCLVMHGDDFKMLIDQGKIQERMTADDPNRGKFDGRVNDLGRHDPGAGWGHRPVLRHQHSGAAAASNRLRRRSARLHPRGH